MSEIAKVLVINYGIEGDPHAYFLNYEDENRSIWEVITKKQVFDMYAFFERHILVNGINDISLETLIKDIEFDVVTLTDENTGESYNALAIELHCQEVEFNGE